MHTVQISNHDIEADTKQQDSFARRKRAMAAFLQRNAVKMSRRDELLAKAAAKRARKNAKRLRDAQASEIGQLKAREALEAGAPRGMWCAGVHAKIEWPDEVRA
jgi:hypothetical protein